MEFVSVELIKKIREHINRIEKQAFLQDEPKKWYQVTSAINTLEDSSCAISYYYETPYPEDISGKYLFTYGLMQALSVQQDAINSINKALFDKDIDFKTNYPDAYKIREIRNDILHPTERRGQYYIQLTQISMAKNGFDYIKSCSLDTTYEAISVNAFSAINEVAICINEVLTKTLNELNKEFSEYIEKHKKRKMANIFSNLDYAQQLICEFSHRHSIGLGQYNEIKHMVEKCAEEVILRYGKLEAADEFKFLIDDLNELFFLLDDSLLPQLQYREKYEKYLLECIFTKLRELEKNAKGIDEYFENNGDTPITEKTINRVVITLNNQEYCV